MKELKERICSFPFKSKSYGKKKENEHGKLASPQVFPFTLPYFFSYRMEFFSFQNSPKYLDPSNKMVLDLWDCLGRVTLVLKQNFIGMI